MSEAAAAAVGAGSTPAPSSTSTGGSSPTSTPVSTGSASAPSSPSSGGLSSGGAQSPGGAGSPSGTQNPAQSSSPSADLFEVKVNGKVQKMTRQQVLDLASMSHAANQRFDEASRMRKEWESRIQNYQKDPMQAFLDHTKDWDEEKRRDALESYYARQYIEPEKLSPAEKKAMQLEAELERYRTQEKESAEQARRKEELELTEKAKGSLQEQIVKAYEKSGLPPRDKFLIGRCAFYLKQNLDHGWDAPMETVIEQVKSERRSYLSDYVQNADVPTIINDFGEDFVKKIAKHYVDQLREQRQKREVPFSAEPSPMKGPEKVYTSDVERNLRDIRLGKKTF
jgi:hypothetical protein